MFIDKNILLFIPVMMINNNNKIKTTEIVINKILLNKMVDLELSRYKMYTNFGLWLLFYTRSLVTQTTNY